MKMLSSISLGILELLSALACGVVNSVEFLLHAKISPLGGKGKVDLLRIRYRDEAKPLSDRNVLG